MRLFFGYHMPSFTFRGVADTTRTPEAVARVGELIALLRAEGVPA
jgi:hypothetical protein